MTNKGYLLFNGIKYPFAVIEAAITWALQSRSGLVALFVRARDVAREGYLFPSDLDAAETVNTAKDAGAGLEAIVESNINMLRNEARRHDVDLEIKTLTEPSDDDLLNEISGASMVFAADNLDEQGTLTVDSIDWAKVLHQYPSKVFH